MHREIDSESWRVGEREKGWEFAHNEEKSALIRVREFFLDVPGALTLALIIEQLEEGLRRAAAVIQAEFGENAAVADAQKAEMCEEETGGGGIVGVQLAAARVIAHERSGRITVVQLPDAFLGALRDLLGLLEHGFVQPLVCFGPEGGETLGELWCAQLLDVELALRIGVPDGTVLRLHRLRELLRFRQLMWKVLECRLPRESTPIVAQDRSHFDFWSFVRGKSAAAEGREGREFEEHQKKKVRKKQEKDKTTQARG
jgi:hypothetical protein